MKIDPATGQIRAIQQRRGPALVLPAISSQDTGSGNGFFRSASGSNDVLRVSPSR